MVKVGLLALQGAFEKHSVAFLSLGAETVYVKKPQDLIDCDALVIPGGESTSMTRQLEFSKLNVAISHFMQTKPVWGTCAGLILLSKGFPLAALDVTVERNAYGRQTESFVSSLSFQNSSIDAYFIRAPKIISIDSDDVEVLATHQNTPVFVKQNKILGTSFHPELSKSRTIHQYFLAMCT